MSVVISRGTSLSPAKSGRLPLLIIEDEPSVMAFLRSALERHGLETVCAGSAREGLELLSTRHFRAIVSDMRTPGGVTGADLHHWVTLNRPELAGRILFITGDTVNRETHALLKKTGAPCIEKPFRVSQLIAILTKLLGGADE